MRTKIPAHTPVEIGRASTHDVKIRWDDGHESVYPARELRLKCPCAACVDEMTGQTRLTPPPVAAAEGGAAANAAGPSDKRTGGGVITSSIAETVHPVKIDLVGRYAIAIHWSDGHNTGIYTFDLLRKLCPCCA